jgi:predicted ATP-dependent endonuclease of OLD family
LATHSVEIDEDINTLIESSDLNLEDKLSATFAVSCLEYVEATKGLMAFELANSLTSYNPTEDSLEFNLPLHIKNAVSWACRGVYDELQ